MKIILFFLFFLNLLSIAFSQVDSSDHKIDTVIIHHNTVIIQKQIIFKEPPKEKVLIDSGNYLTFYFSPFIPANYYSVCSDCQDYFIKYSQATQQKMGLSFGIISSFTFKRILISPSLSYRQYREKFNYSQLDPSLLGYTTNTYNQMDFGLSIGYIFKKNSFLIIPDAGISYNHLLSIRGVTVSETDLQKAEDILKVRNYKKYTLSLCAGIKILRSISDKLSLYIEPGYAGEIKSVIKNKEPFSQQRNSFGVAVGLSRKF